MLLAVMGLIYTIIVVCWLLLVVLWYRLAMLLLGRQQAMRQCYILLVTEAKDKAEGMMVGGYLKLPREEQGVKIVQLVIHDNQVVDSEVVGASKKAKWWFTLRGEHVPMEELLRDS
jgi:hypothetical protein